jgi:hypothetical protein
MRTMLLLTLALAGCGDDLTNSAVDLSMPDLAGNDNDLPRPCIQTCPVCTGGTVCVTGNAGLVPFDATCLKPCSESADCSAPARCVRIDNGVPSGRYCVMAAAPRACVVECDLVPATSECDGNDLVTPYHIGVCGLQYARCANGCVEDLPDAGFNRMAHCL